jgi:hypothetical protein
MTSSSTTITTRCAASAGPESAGSHSPLMLPYKTDDTTSGK